MKTLEESERVFGHRSPKTLWALGVETKELLLETHVRRTIIDNNEDEISVYIDVTCQFKKPQDFFEDMKKNGNFMVKIPVRVSERLKWITTKSRFFIFHRNYLNIMDDEEIPRVVVINNRALKKTFIFREIFPDSLQFVRDPSALWFNEAMGKTSFEEVEVIKKKFTQTSFL